MIFETLCLVKAMMLSILTAGLALRGPEGSMTHALKVMRDEYRNVHFLFMGGLISLLISASLITIVSLPALTAGILTFVLIFGGLAFLIWNYRRVGNKLRGRSVLNPTTNLFFNPDFSQSEDAPGAAPWLSRVEKEPAGEGDGKPRHQRPSVVERLRRVNRQPPASR